MTETETQNNTQKTADSFNDIAKGMEKLSSIELTPNTVKGILLGVGLGVGISSGRIIGHIATPSEIESGQALLNAVISDALPMVGSLVLGKHIDKRSQKMTKSIPLSTHVGPFIAKGLRALASEIRI